jgi:hypothetical protein
VCGGGGGTATREDEVERHTDSEERRGGVTEGATVEGCVGGLHVPLALSLRHNGLLHFGRTPECLGAAQMKRNGAAQMSVVSQMMGGTCDRH